MRLVQLGCIAVLLSAIGAACRADEVEVLLAELRSASVGWEQLFDGTHFVATVRLNRPDGEEEIFEYDYSQRTPDAWRLDLRRGERVSLVRDSDFWFCVVEELENWRYDRLGFDQQTVQSIGASLQSQNPLLSCATHVLDIPLLEFVSLPEVRWKCVEPPQNPNSEHRLTWVLTPDGPGGFMPAFGVIEWRSGNGGTLLTHYEYYFGLSDTPAPKGVSVDVDYDQFDGRLVPLRSVRTESGVVIETKRGAIRPAEADPMFYTAESFGLDRPTKPWQSWQIWISLGIAGATLTVVLRYLRSVRSR